MKINGFGTMPQTQVTVQTQEAPAVMVDDRQFLDFEQNKVQPLTLDQLMRTNRENRGDDNSQPHGIYHYALIQKMLDMASEHGFHPEVYDLFATNNRDKQTPGVSLYPELEKQYGERAVEAHTIRRVYANIRIKDFDDEETTTNMALAYTQMGIQVGIGTNVKVCHNQNMLGRGNFVSDYSTHFKYASGEIEKKNLDGIIETIASWLTNLENIVVTERDMIHRMKATVIDADTLYKIIGLLATIRTASDTSIKRIKYKGNIYPMNQSQLNKWIEALLVEQKDHGQITAWSMYNAATNLYKPATAETNLILPQNMAFTEFMRNYEIIH